MPLTLKGQKNIGINATGATPNASAMLDIVSTTSGVLIPRMTHHQMAIISSPATGLLVYSTDTIGFYYYNGAAWVPLLSNSLNNGGWALTGNASTVPSVAAIGSTLTANSNFLGTTDSSFVIATNNGTATYERIRVKSSGNVGISNNAPGALLDIGTAGTDSGYVRLEGHTSGYVGLYTTATAGSYNLKLPPNTGAPGQMLTTDGSGVTTWTSASGGLIDSVEGTVPIYVTSNFNTPVITIQGLNTNKGGVLYSTGTLTSAAFTATGTAPSGNATQILVSQGTGAPTWNTVGGVVQVIFKGEQNSGSNTIDETQLENIGENKTYFLSNVLGGLSLTSTAATQYTMPKCLLTRLHLVTSSNSITGMDTITVYKNGSPTTMVDTLSNNAANSLDYTSNPVTFADGDYLELRIKTPNTGVFTQLMTIVKIEITYYLLP